MSPKFTKQNSKYCFGVNKTTIQTFNLENKFFPSVGKNIFFFCGGIGFDNMETWLAFLRKLILRRKWLREKYVNLLLNYFSSLTKEKQKF